MIEVLKALVRPILIISTWQTILYMWVSGIDIPSTLQGVAIAIVGEYFLERAVKRIRE